MPIDLSAVKTGQENQLDALLNSRAPTLEENLKKYTGAVGASRNNFLQSGFNPLLANITGKLNLPVTGEPMQFQTGNLDQRLKDTLNKQRLKGSQDTMGLKLDNATRRLGEATDTQRTTEGYSRQQAAIKAQKDFERQQLLDDLNHQVQISEMGDNFDVQSNMLSDAYAPKTDYDMALASALSSLVGAGAGTYFGNKTYPIKSMIGTPNSPGVQVDNLDSGSNLA